MAITLLQPASSSSQPHPNRETESPHPLSRNRSGHEQKHISKSLQRWLQQKPNEEPWSGLKVGDCTPSSHSLRATKSLHASDARFLGKPQPPKSSTGKRGLRALAEGISAALNSSSSED